MIAFIDDHREVYGVEPICKVLPIAPSTYRAHVARRADPAKAPPRARRDAVLKGHIRRVWDANFQVYGVRKVWRQLGREGIDVARCTVARLMREMGLQGAVRGKTVRTTVSDKAAPCPRDKVNREFRAPAPNRLWVSDFTYVATWAGFSYVAARHRARTDGASTARSSTSSRAASSDGASRAAPRPASSSTPSNRRCTLASLPSGGWSTTATAAPSMSRSATPSASQRRGSSPPSAASATRTTIYGRLPLQGGLQRRRRPWMRESIRPVAGAVTLLASMGSAASGLITRSASKGRVIGQALGLRSTPWRHRRLPRSHRRSRGDLMVPDRHAGANVSFRVSIAQAARAVLLAMATMPLLKPRRSITDWNQRDRPSVFVARRSATARAPCTSCRRR